MNNKTVRFEVSCHNFFVSQTFQTDDNIQTKQHVFFGKSRNFKKDLDFLGNYLSAEEINRMNRFISEDDRLTYCVVHGLLRLSFSEILLCEDPIIKSSENVKPFLTNYDIDFNLSHSKNFFAFTISEAKGGNVGVDIEKIKPLKYFKTIIRDFMHPNEKDYIIDNSVSVKEQSMRFYEIWTRKEAFLKMLGVGITTDLSLINMIPGNNIVIVDVNESYQVKNKKINVFTLTRNDFALSVSADFMFLPDFIERRDIR